MSCAYIGHARANGLGPWQVMPNGWSQVMIDEHQAEIEELKKRHPDDPAAKGKSIKLWTREEVDRLQREQAANQAPA